MSMFAAGFTAAVAFVCALRSDYKLTALMLALCAVNLWFGLR